jgi:hypothetical protein
MLVRALLVRRAGRLHPLERWVPRSSRQTSPPGSCLTRATTRPPRCPSSGPLFARSCWPRWRRSPWRSTRCSTVPALLSSSTPPGGLACVRPAGRHRSTTQRLTADCRCFRQASVALGQPPDCGGHRNEQSRGRSGDSRCGPDTQRRPPGNRAHPRRTGGFAAPFSLAGWTAQPALDCVAHGILLDQVWARCALVLRSAAKTRVARRSGELRRAARPQCRRQRWRAACLPPSRRPRPSPRTRRLRCDANTQPRTAGRSSADHTRVLASSSSPPPRWASRTA